MGSLGENEVCLRCGKDTPDTGMPKKLLDVLTICATCSPIVILNLKDLIVK